VQRRAPTSPVFDELRGIQRAHGYLPDGELRALAARLDLPLFRLQAVASFYPHFFLKPPARAEVRVCGDMVCHRRGGNDLRERLEARYQGQDVNVRHVSCLGRCDFAPAMVVNDQIFEEVTETEAGTLIEFAAAGASPEQLAERRAPPRLARIDCDPYPDAASRYGVLRSFVQSKDWAALIATLKASGLRGLGGAGFPTGVKWEQIRSQPGPDKYFICNADESEPGTIKDRHIMTNGAHLLVEGTILGGLVAGARHGIIYIRHEYTDQEHILQQELDRCYRDGILGESVCGSELAFDLEIFVSPGLYICGEGSALLEALEGKRAEPRNRPPHAGEVGGGLWGRPTVVNNVETLFFVPVILSRGADWMKTSGRKGALGEKFIGVSGDVVNPGVFEVPMGTSYRELIEGLAGGVPAGRTLKAYAPSGPTGGFLPASMLDLPLDWHAMTAAGATVGSGAVVVCDDRACMLDMALNCVRFYRNESCGKCVPCRTGSAKMADMIAEWTRGRRGAHDLALYEELCHALKTTSICGLGQVVHVPIASVMKHFPDEIEGHLKGICQAGVCFRIGAGA
jgi:formate dehydrogenase beta subunit